MRKEMHTYTYKPPTNAASPFASNAHTLSLLPPGDTVQTRLDKHC